MSHKRAHVLVCAGAGCVSSGCKDVRDTLIREIEAAGLADEVNIVETGCMGPCDLGPVMVIYPEGVFYQKVKPEDAKEIVEEHLLKGRVVEHLLHREAGEELRTTEEMDFFKNQTRIALRNTGIIDPERIEEYIARDGYAALAKAVSQMTPEEVVAEVKKSGLRGRGGAGFPTGLKWQFTARAGGHPKYVVCNADEGDPGAFMDRSIIEGDPHSLIEAMAIAGYAVGANQGYVYVRAEYPLAVERLEKAIVKAREFGLLGKDIFGAGFDFDLEIRVGAGAFVCGEETALINSIMGKRGEPRPKPPFPATQGVFDKPTLLNNVETYANIAPIILKGADWFTQFGTEKCPGTKVFALAGKINNTGLVEVPMGTTLGDIIYDIGGGIPNGKKFKAAQLGGPSGGCIPAEHLNVPVDYESLTELGAMMGSGGLIVMDEDTCMVDLARFFLEFCQDESCGKCVPCRIGTKRMLEILERIAHGEGQEGDIERLERLGRHIKDNALCGLGQTAPNPVLSTIRYFRDEYEAHIRDKRCRATVCASLYTSPCQNACPAHVDVPLYIDAVRRDKPQEAYDIIRRENPLPIICGRVCNHPCESKCQRAQVEDPVAIRALKRYAADYVYDQEGCLPAGEVAGEKDARVAVVGSGPAGLTAAYYLRRLGYQVTMYEALPVPGGMMKAGIPEYRLPKQFLDAEINSILKMGVQFIGNTRVGEDISLSEIGDKHDAIFLAIGAHKGLGLEIEGAELDGVVQGIDFLRAVNIDGKPNAAVKGCKVKVVGGGNVAIDAARTALRLGAADVEIIYRRRLGDMPALPEEIEAAVAEGIKITELVNPVHFIGENGKLTAVKLEKMIPGKFDRSGRRRPEQTGKTYTTDCDVAMLAIGQVPDSTELANQVGLSVSGRGTFVADMNSGATNLPGIFTGGDCVTGPATVVEAIGAGKAAAAAIDRYLGGDGKVVPDLQIERKLTGPVIEEELPRVAVPELPAESRKGSFAEVELGYDPEMAKREAARCLRCDVK